MKDQAETHQHPRKVRRREYQQSQEAQTGIWISSGPDVYERGREWVAEERHRDKWRDTYQTGHGVE